MCKYFKSSLQDRGRDSRELSPVHNKPDAVTSYLNRSYDAFGPPNHLFKGHSTHLNRGFEKPYLPQIDHIGFWEDKE